jgi:hypothetical protein
MFDWGGSVYWDITPCIPLKINRRFGRTYCLYLQVQKISQARNQYEEGTNRLHGVVSRKIELFITAVVRI